MCAWAIWPISKCALWRGGNPHPRRDSPAQGGRLRRGVRSVPATPLLEDATPLPDQARVAQQALDGMDTGVADAAQDLHGRLDHRQAVLGILC